MKNLKSNKFQLLIALMLSVFFSFYAKAQTTTLSVGGKTRSMFVYAPSGIAQNRPLVISLHGLNQDVNYQKGQAKWENVADTAKIVVVYPQGESNSWDINGTKDTDFILAIIESMVTRYGIDRNRVFVSGFSMGGMMSYHTANKIADKVAAIGPVSGYLFGNTVASSRPMPIIHVHGTADDVVHYEPYQSQQGVVAMLQKWRTWDACPSTGTTITPYPVGTSSKATYQKWSPCNKSEVVLISIPGKGHWHSNDPAGVMTTSEIWWFFKKQSLNASQFSVSFTSLANNAVSVSGAAITLSATAISSTSTIANVKLYDGTTLLTTLTTSPYTYSWTNASVGTHTLKAVATDDKGNSSETTTSIKVNLPQGPYNGTWSLIPGTIQFENFDVGGNGSAYSDASAGNTGGATFRTDEDVDIENCTDAGTGYNIGYATAGEWLEYSVDVQKPGTYDIDFRVACNADSRTLSLSLDGVNLTKDLAIPNTAGWQTWKTISVKNVNLKAGKQILRLTIGVSDYINLNYVTFTLVKELKQEPYNNTVHVIPGKIEAEEYDLGGEGLAYHEGDTLGNQGGATFRTDGVDIENCTDAGLGYNIGYGLKDEWLEYSINVTNTGNYDLSLRVAKDGTGGLMHIEFDGVDVTGPISIPNTTGWQKWQTVTLPNIKLTQGAQIMKIVFDANYTNLNYVEFKDVVTSLEKETSEEFAVYPNPFGANGFKVNAQGDYSYSISNMIGTEIESGWNNGEMSIGKNLVAGIYILTIDKGTTRSSFKILKQ